MLGVSTSSTTMGGPWWKRTTARRSWAWTCTGAGSVLVRMAEDGHKLSTVRIANSPARLAAEIKRAGLHPKMVLEACYGWYWAADTLTAAGAEVHLAHPLGVKEFSHRRVKNDELDARDLADLLRMGRLGHGRPARRS